MSRSSQSLRVLIHAGTHKTGTTSIQAVLSDHRKRLRRRGVLYPDTKPYLGGGRHAHHRFAHALVGTDEHMHEAAHRFVDRLRATAQPGETILLSSEAFYRHVHGTRRWRSVSKQDYWALRTRYLARVAEMLPASEVGVLLYLRRPDLFAESLYRENVTKSLAKLSFYEWLRRTHPLFQYSAQIQAFSDTFPSVQVYRYEDAVDDGLVESFFRQLGLPAPAPGPWTRRSPDARLILWMHDRRPGTWEQRREFAASEEAMSLFDDYGATTLWESAEDRDAFLHQFNGAYGADFFPQPQEMPPPATLSDEDARRIDDAWARWQHRNGHR